MKEIEPIVKTTEESHIVGIWCIHIPIQPLFPWGGDFMQTLFRDGLEGVVKWQVNARLRIVTDPDEMSRVRFTNMVDEKIDKSYSLPPCPQAKAEKLCEEFLRRIAKACQVESENQEDAFLRVDGPQDKIVWLCMKGDAPPWLHVGPAEGSFKDIAKFKAGLEKRYGPI